MKIIKYLFYWLCIPLLFINISQAENISFSTHLIKPFSYQEKGEIKGFAVEVVREMMKLQGYPQEFKLYPFIRGLKVVQIESNRAFFIVARRPEREKTVKWVGPLVTSGVYLYKKRGSDINASNLAEVKNKYSVVVHRGNADHYFLQKENFTSLYNKNNQMQTIQMVNRRRIDLTPISELVMPQIAKEAGIDIKDIERTNIKLYDSTLYLAFSLDIPDKTVDQWQQALDTLKTSGKYREIYNKYLQ